MPPAGGRPQRPQGGGNYGQGGPQRGAGRSDYTARPDGRFDNPGYRR
jgi:hypothetical protein